MAGRYGLVEWRIMSYGFLDIATTPSVRAAQAAMGSDGIWQDFKGHREFDRFTPEAAAFIDERDSFYMATVSEAGWPYVQHRGGAPGFLKVLDERTLAFADYRGNRQYISVGNLGADERVCLILMDYPRQARLKIFARVEVVPLDADAALARLVAVAGYRAKPERILKLHLQPSTGTASSTSRRASPKTRSTRRCAPARSPRAIGRRERGSEGRSRGISSGRGGRRGFKRDRQVGGQDQRGRNAADAGHPAGRIEKVAKNSRTDQPTRKIAGEVEAARRALARCRDAADIAGRDGLREERADRDEAEAGDDRRRASRRASGASRPRRRRARSTAPGGSPIRLTTDPAAERRRYRRQEDEVDEADRHHAERERRAPPARN